MFMCRQVCIAQTHVTQAPKYNLVDSFKNGHVLLKMK